MTDENRETLQVAFDALARRDLAAAQSLCHPEAELRNTIGGFEGKVYRGDRMVEEWLADIEEFFDDYRIEVDAIEGEGEVFVVSARNLAHAHGSGIPIDLPTYPLVVFKDGQIWRVEIFRAKEEALEAAGLSA